MTKFQDFKEQVLSKRIGRKPVSLSEIKLISENAIQVHGLPLALSSEGFKSLLRLIGITNKMRQGLKKHYGDSFTDNLISTMGNAMSASKGGVVLLIDLTKRRVINIVRSTEEMIDHERYLKNVERVISDSNLEIDSMIVRDNGGFAISTIGDNTEWGLKGVESTESFKFGLNFDNDPVKGTRLMPFNQRLVCTNGMIGQNFVGVHQLTNNKDSWEQFFHNINVLKQDNFKPIEFSSTLKSVMKSNASVGELVQARNLIKANSKVTDQELEIFAPIASTEEAYKKKGLILDDFNKDQRQNAPTDVSYWELVNGITDFASHNYGHEVSNADTLQRFAGRMFVKKPDLTNLVVNPFN